MFCFLNDITIFLKRFYVKIIFCQQILYNCVNNKKSMLRSHKVVSVAKSSIQMKCWQNGLSYESINGFKTFVNQPCYQLSTEKIKKKADAYWRLCRNHQPIGSMLLYWPTAWGVCVGSQGAPSLFYLSLFLMGSFAARSAGCIVNDYLDKDFDKNVERTKSRPLASGEVNSKEAGALLFANLSVGLCVLLNMPKSAVITAFSFVALGGVYPLAKRFTNYPQFVLGMAFNSGIIIASMSVNPNILPLTVVPLYISGIAWTLVYDTVYAYQVFMM